MRILYIVTSLGVGGAERQAVSLAESMAARGHSVALLSLKHAEHEVPFAIPALRLNMRKSLGGLARALRFAQNFITLFRPDILHSHTFPANIFARLLILARPRKSVRPLVLNTIHNVYEGGWHRKAIYAATRNLADCLTAVSGAAAEAHARSTLSPRQRIQILVNGIDTWAYMPDKVRRLHTRAMMGAGEHYIWLAVGRIAPAKDYPNLLKAWMEVRGKHPAARLWIAGEGKPDEVMEALSISEETQRLGVEWLGLRSDVADLLDAADGYVLSSAWEGMPLAVGEAMAMGKNIVATDAGGVSELLGDTGLLVPVGDSSALAAGMLAVMAMSPKERTKQAGSARQRVEMHFSIETAVEKWEQLYTALTGQRTAG